MPRFRSPFRRKKQLPMETGPLGTIRLLVLIAFLILAMAINFVLYIFISGKQGLLPASGLRYLLLPLLALATALNSGILYVKHLFKIESYSKAFGYMVALLFGYGYPLLVVRDGERLLVTGVDNLLDRLGGPGILVIQPGGVAPCPCQGTSRRGNGWGWGPLPPARPGALVCQCAPGG